MEKTLKSDLACTKIRDLILSGQILPGTRLVLAELMEQTGLGKGPVRDALIRLGKSGLIENIPYKGAVARPLPTAMEMKNLYRLRLIAERELALEAMRKITPDDIAALQRIITSTDSAHESESNFFSIDRDFHKKLYSIANMKHLEDVVNNIMDHIGVFLSSYYYTYADKNKIVQEHLDILEAITSRNEELLKDRIKKNILIGLVFINKHMAKFDTLRILNTR